MDGKREKVEKCGRSLLLWCDYELRRGRVGENFARMFCVGMWFTYLYVLQQLDLGTRQRGSLINSRHQVEVEWWGGRLEERVRLGLKVRGTPCALGIPFILFNGTLKRATETNRWGTLCRVRARRPQFTTHSTVIAPGLVVHLAQWLAGNDALLLPPLGMTKSFALFPFH